MTLATQSSRLIPSTRLYIITIHYISLQGHTFQKGLHYVPNGGEMLYDNPE